MEDAIRNCGIFNGVRCTNPDIERPYIANQDWDSYQYVSFRNEITARKLEEEKLDTLIATMPDIVIFQDGDGRWLKANDAATQLFPLDSDTYRGLTTSELIERVPNVATERPESVS